MKRLDPRLILAGIPAWLLLYALGLMLICGGILLFVSAAKDVLG